MYLSYNNKNKGSNISLRNFTTLSCEASLSYDDKDNYLSSLIKQKQNQIFIIKNQNETLDKETHSAIIKLKEKVGDLKDKFLTFNEAKNIFKSTKYELPEDNLPEGTRIIFMNKYGDVLYYTDEEFQNIIEVGDKLNFFNSIGLINKYESILRMNDNDFFFFYFINNDKGEFLQYNDKDFTLFRKLFVNLNFTNVNYFIATDKQSSDFTSKLPDLTKGLYLIRRKPYSSISLNDNKISKAKIVSINDEEFELYSLSDQITSSVNRSNYLSLFKKACLSLGVNFYLYSPNALSIKNSLELFPMFFRKTPYYILFTDLQYEDNKKTANRITALLNEKESDSSSLFIIVDNNKYKDSQYFVKTFEDKHLTPSFLEKTKIPVEIEHFKPIVTKKILTENLTDEEINKIINKKMIDESENSIISKKSSANIQQIDNEILDLMIKSKQSGTVFLVNSLYSDYEQKQMDKTILSLSNNKSIKGSKFYSMINSSANVKQINSLSMSKYNKMNTPFALVLSNGEVEKIYESVDEYAKVNNI